MKKYKKGLIIGSLSLALIGGLLISSNKTKQVLVTEETLKSNDKIAIYIKNESGAYEKSNTIPTSGYVLNETDSTCNNNAKPTWNTKNNNLKITNLSKANTSCYLYFDIDTKTDSEKLAIGLVGESNISDARAGEITVDTEMDNTKLYSVLDGMYGGTSYVYAGTDPSNWVSFAGFYWRIIRINGDGSIRLIYNGTSATAIGEGTQIGTRKYNIISSGDNAYVGFMYGSTGQSTYEATHTNTNNSTILGNASGTDSGSLNYWYKNNIANKSTMITSKIDTNGIFCNDREVKTGVVSGFTGNGAGTSATSYAPWVRLFSESAWKTSQTPSLSCTQANDIFSASGATKGNKKLTYPVALITSDEVVLAGGFGSTGTTPRTFWLNTGQIYWTMSPRYSASPHAYVFRVGSDGNLDTNTVNSECGVRPVINLASDVTLKGSGTTTDPYIVEGAE